MQQVLDILFERVGGLATTFYLACWGLTMENSCDHFSLILTTGATALNIKGAIQRLQAQTVNRVPSSLYIYDLVDQYTLHSTSGIAELLGYPPQDLGAKSAIRMGDLIHSVDLERVADHYQRFTCLLESEVIAVEYRMLRPDGTWCWLRSQETPLVMAIDGFPLQIIGLIQDITDLPTANSTINSTDKTAADPPIPACWQQLYAQSKNRTLQFSSNQQEWEMAELNLR
jgi:PAS domain S-box-containing protein